MRDLNSLNVLPKTKEKKMIKKIIGLLLKDTLITMQCNA